MKWIAFFSQTGSEIVNLSTLLNIKPTLLVTNNNQSRVKFHPGIEKMDVTIMSGRHDILMNYFKDTLIYGTDLVITLHGYLRIIPKEVCEKYTVYNGHPGAIHLYPELKGLDPQERVWQEREKYPTIGSVIHKVTPIVDDGEILTSMVTINDCKTKEELYEALKMTSLNAWTKFFDEVLCV